ncbi:Aste57867_859 [Aphanomyces stellatus]|uniref:Aste57867_859 protein n=1 Tax=Aphanomyces stellatus TaxID=120398 RepID=A0A485K421_9STRA|nr:hypothetical protein As57867_000858 [Aphanomyces stellatus]VFT78083.1 Aste57867_859 [Aphanomyces stellatus]
MDLPNVPQDYDWEAFRANAHRTIDFIVDYHLKLQARAMPVQPVACEPGSVRRQLPPHAPDEPVAWNDTMATIERIIVPNMTHWQHPDFLAYFPSLGAPSAILGDLLANAMNQPGFSWSCSPAATELELHVMDWLREAFDLPLDMSWGSGMGGGVLQPSATEAMIVAQVSARTRKLAAQPTVSLDSLVTYYSDQSHFCVEKASKVLGVRHLRAIPSVYDPVSGNYAMDVALLEATIQDDVAHGHTPFFVSCNFGATGVGAVDAIPAVAAVAKRYDLWLNIDAAYAGVVRVLPDRRFDGVDLCDSLLVNGSKWFNVLFGASFFFFRDRQCVVRSLNATGVYLSNSNPHGIDLKDYHLGLGRPFRALKVFCAMQSLGLQGFRDVIRRHIVLAQYLAQTLGRHGLEIVRDVDFGLVCFRLPESTDADNMALLHRLEDVEGIHLVHTTTQHHGVVLRISLSSPRLTQEDMDALAAKIDRSRHFLEKDKPSSTAGRV